MSAHTTSARQLFHSFLVSGFAIAPNLAVAVLVAVNRETQERAVKPSGRYLGWIARRNAMPEPAGK
jgi:hypothetical protein